MTFKKHLCKRETIKCTIKKKCKRETSVLKKKDGNRPKFTFFFFIYFIFIFIEIT